MQARRAVAGKYYRSAEKRLISGCTDLQNN
jgi:hypothetical protein